MVCIGWQNTLRKAHGGVNTTVNTMNTGNTMDGLWHTAGYTLRKFHYT